MKHVARWRVRATARIAHIFPRVSWPPLPRLAGHEAWMAVEYDYRQVTDRHPWNMRDERGNNDGRSGWNSHLCPGRRAASAAPSASESWRPRLWRWRATAPTARRCRQAPSRRRSCCPRTRSSLPTAKPRAAGSGPAGGAIIIASGARAGCLRPSSRTPASRMYAPPCSMIMAGTCPSRKASPARRFPGRRPARPSASGSSRTRRIERRWWRRSGRRRSARAQTHRSGRAHRASQERISQKPRSWATANALTNRFLNGSIHNGGPWDLACLSCSACAIVFASRKSRMGAPLHRRTEKIGAHFADPFTDGEGGGRRLIRSPSPKGAGGGCICPRSVLTLAWVWCQPLGLPILPARASVTPVRGQFFCAGAHAARLRYLNQRTDLLRRRSCALW